VLIDSTLIENEATGGDVQVGRGGHGGAIFMTGARGALSVCGSRLSKNRASAHGGALYRLGEGDASVTIDRSTFDENYALPEGSPGQGGAAHLQGAVVELTGSTISNNAGTSGGGLYVTAKGRSELTMANVTVANNQAIAGPGGGLRLGAGVKASLLNVTVVANQAGATMGGGGGMTVETADAKLTNTIVASNRLAPEGGPDNCTGKMLNGGGNVQFPLMTALCADGALGEDPALEELADNGGLTWTVAVRSGSPAIGIGNGCPATDQRGRPRKTPCTSGAFEAD